MRFVIALALVAATSVPALAGERCARRPAYVFIAPGVSLDESAQWHRGTGAQYRSGTLSQDAFTRIKTMGPKATSGELTRCLDALIADEHGKAAARACVAKR